MRKAKVKPDAPPSCFRGDEYCSDAGARAAAAAMTPEIQAALDRANCEPANYGILSHFQNFNANRDSESTNPEFVMAVEPDWHEIFHRLDGEPLESPEREHGRRSHGLQISKWLDWVASPDLSGPEKLSAMGIRVIATAHLMDLENLRGIDLRKILKGGQLQAFQRAIADCAEKMGWPMTIWNHHQKKNPL